MAKFKSGDKVRITAFKHGNDREAKYRIGDIITIDNVYCEGPCPAYEIVGDDDWIFYEDELEPVKDNTCKHDCSTCTCHDDTVTLSVDIPLDDKKEAHRIVHAIVEKAYQDAAKPKTKPLPNPWTAVEIERARRIVTNWTEVLINHGGDLYWHIQPEDGLEAVVYKSLNADDYFTGYAAPHHSDEYNVWIGKCVSLAKALNKPIPDFITNKNMGD